MWYQDYDFVYAQFEKGHQFVDETVFYFKSDLEETEHYIGYYTGDDKPYWAGLCDVPGGLSFSSAKELFEARIYAGKSIKERWSDLVLVSMGGINVEEMSAFWFDNP